MKPVKIKVPELGKTGVQRACLDLLEWEHIWHFRANTGAIRNDKGRPVRFGRKGMADILATPIARYVYFAGDAIAQDGLKPQAAAPLILQAQPLTRTDARETQYILWIECKSSTGAQRDEQIEFEREVSEAGHHYLVVRDVDTLRNWLRDHGVIR